MSDFKKILNTEKTKRISSLGCYVILVNKNLSKIDIKLKFENTFDVKVESVNTSHIRAYEKNFKNKIGKTSSMKKAIIKLKPGFNIQSIQLEKNAE